MRKKQKTSKKRKSQRAFKDFISIVKRCKNDFDVIPYISNIYGNEYRKKEVTVYRLPIWRNITQVQKLAYFFYFMAETKGFENIKPFTLVLSKPFRDKYKKLTYKSLKATIIKRVFGNLDYILKSSKPKMLFILENKSKRKRKDVNDKETHIHGIREVFDEAKDSKVRSALKTSVCNGKKEYNEPKHRNMLQTKDGYNKYDAKGWLWYLNKGICSNNGLYISQSLLKEIRQDYELLYKEYKENIKALEKLGIKIKYKKSDT